MKSQQGSLPKYTSTLIYCCFCFWFLHHQSLRFLHRCHLVTLGLTQLSSSHFGSYTVATSHFGSYTIVIYSLWFLYRRHSTRFLYHGHYFGSYTVIFGPYTIVRFCSYTIGLYFAILTPFVVSLMILIPLLFLPVLIPLSLLLGLTPVFLLVQHQFLYQ